LGKIIRKTTTCCGQRIDMEYNTKNVLMENSMNKIKNNLDIPKFGEPIQNQTIAVGREAVFSCVVDNLQTYKVSLMMMLSWLFLGICLIDFDDNYGGFVDDKG
jgi:hypothetical protein